MGSLANPIEQIDVIKSLGCRHRFTALVTSGQFVYCKLPRSVVIHTCRPPRPKGFNLTSRSLISRDCVLGWRRPHITMSLRVLEIILLILYWAVVVPIIVIIIGEMNWIWKNSDYLESFKLYFLIALGLSTLFWIVFIMIIFIYTCLKRLCTVETDQQLDRGPAETMLIVLDERALPLAPLQNRQPMESLLTTVGPSLTPQRPAHVLPKKPKKGARVLDLPPSYSQICDKPYI